MREISLKKEPTWTVPHWVELGPVPTALMWKGVGEVLQGHDYSVIIMSHSEEIIRPNKFCSQDSGEWLWITSWLPAIFHIVCLTQIEDDGR